MQKVVGARELKNRLGTYLTLQEQLGRPIQFMAFDLRLKEAALGEGLALA